MTLAVYKQSSQVRTALYALIAAFFLVFAPICAIAEVDSTYTVEGVEVDVTAKNAVLAREKAMMEAQVKAYEMLAERFMTPEEFKVFKAPDADTVSMLVQDLEVTNEQLSTTRYKGVFTIRFRPNALKSQMASQGKDISGGIPKPVMVLPIFEQSGNSVLWMETNPWMRAWRNLPTDRSMMQPTVVPLGDAADIAQIGDREGLQYDPMKVQELANRYNAEDVAILLASSVPTPTSQGRVTINIYSNGFEGPVFVQKVIVDQMAGETDDAVYARAAEKVKLLLRENWKANAAYNPPVTAPDVHTQSPPVSRPLPPPVGHTRPALGASQTYVAQARFASVQDWVRMKSTLDRIYGMQAVMVKGLKPREALLDLRFAGNVTSLQLALQNAGITMRAGYNGGPIELYYGAGAQPIYR